MRYSLFILIVLTSAAASAQKARDLLLGSSLDLIKTDNYGFVRKIQVGAEAQYLFTSEISATVGVEVWTGESVSLALGGRWYPAENFFTRIRVLVGENDLNIGLGWSKPILENWKFEAVGDFYFYGEFAIRAGVVYIVRRKEK